MLQSNRFKGIVLGKYMMLCWLRSPLAGGWSYYVTTLMNDSPHNAQNYKNFMSGRGIDDFDVSTLVPNEQQVAQTLSFCALLGLSFKLYKLLQE